MRYVRFALQTSVVIAGGAPVPTPAPIPDILPSNLSWDPAAGAPPGGCIFDLPAAQANYPSVVRAVYMPAPLDASLTDEAIFNSGHPSTDLAVTGAAEKLTIGPPTGLPDGTYDVVVIGGFA